MTSFCVFHGGSILGNKEKIHFKSNKTNYLILIFAIFTALFIFIYLQNQSSKKNMRINRLSISLANKECIHN